MLLKLGDETLSGGEGLLIALEHRTSMAAARCEMYVRHGLVDVVHLETTHLSSVFELQTEQLYDIHLLVGVYTHALSATKQT